MALFASLPERGTSVLVASHDLGLVKRMKKRVLVLDHGTLADDISPEDLADDDAPAGTENVAAARAAVRGFGTWLDHHLYSFVASLGRVLRRPWATLLTVGVMAVALALPLGLWLALDNCERFAGSVQQSREISVFLKPDDRRRARAGAGARTARPRRRRPRSSCARREQGLAEFRARSGLRRRDRRARTRTRCPAC